MQVDDLAERQISHLGEALVQLVILLEHSCRRGTEFSVRRCQQIRKRRAREIFGGQAEPTGFFTQLVGLSRWQFERQLHVGTVA